MAVGLTADPAETFEVQILHGKKAHVVTVMYVGDEQEQAGTVSSENCAAVSR